MAMRLLGVLSVFGLAVAGGLARADTIETAAGERVTGRIVRIASGTVWLQHEFSGELQLAIASLTSLSSDEPMVADLSNGDRVVGKLEMNGSDAVVVRSSALGDLRLPVTAVNAIVPADASPGAPSPAEAPPAPAAAAVPHPAAPPAERRRAGSAAAAPRRAPAPATADNRPVPAPAPDREVAADREGTIRGRGRSSVAQAGPGAPDTPPGGTTVPLGGTTTPPPDGQQQRPAEAPAESSSSSESGEELGFLRQEAVLLPPGGIEGDLSLGYLRNRSAIENDQAFLAVATLRGSLFSGLEGFITVPFSWGRRELALGSRVIGNEQDGIGDVRAGLKYSVVPQTAVWPNVVANFSFGAPTGKAPYIQPNPPPGVEIIDIRNPLYVPLGTGHWALSAGFSLIKSFDPIILFGSFDYTKLIPATYYGVDVDPGDRFDVNLGFGFGISEYSTVSAQLLSNYQTSWTFNGVKAVQTSGANMSLRLSYTHRASNSDLIEPSIVFGLTKDTTDAIFTLAYTHRF